MKPDGSGKTMQVCYALTTGEHDDFAAMTFISASLVRRIHPGARIIVLCDELSEPILTRRDRILLDLADRLVPVKTGFTLAADRNRFVKTTMRQRIDGDFIYLDGDTLPIREFHEMCVGDLAAVLDRCVQSPEPGFPNWLTEHYNALGWRHPLPRYFNGGVIFMRDNPQMRRFSEEWHRRWIAFLTRGLHLDQPALNSAIEAAGIDAREVPTPYNAMVSVDIRYARQARIFHYYISQTQDSPEPTTVLHRLLETFRQTGAIDWALVDDAAKRSDPFVVPVGEIRGQIGIGNYKTAFKMALDRLKKGAV